MGNVADVQRPQRRVNKPCPTSPSEVVIANNSTCEIRKCAVQREPLSYHGLVSTCKADQATPYLLGQTASPRAKNSRQPLASVLRADSDDRTRDVLMLSGPTPSRTLHA